MAVPAPAPAMWQPSCVPALLRSDDAVALSNQFDAPIALVKHSRYSPVCRPQTCTGSTDVILYSETTALRVCPPRLGLWEEGVQRISTENCHSAERLAEGQRTNAASAAAAATAAIAVVFAADIQDLSSVARQLATL